MTAKKAETTPPAPDEGKPEEPQAPEQPIAAPEPVLVTIRLLEPVERYGRTVPAGAEIEVPERRAAIWIEGQVAELV